MKLAIDVGNTTTAFGFFKEKLVEKIIISTDRSRAKDDFLLILSRLVKEKHIFPHEIDYVVYSSVVPQVNDALLTAVQDLFRHSSVFTVDSSIKTNFDIKVQNKDEIGGDLLADLAGAAALYKKPVLIVDLGTATKVLLLDKQGCFTTCLIMPGMEISASLLSNKAALLPSVGLDHVKKITQCNNTIDAMKGGIVYGHLEMIKGVIRRYEDELGYKCEHVITGGAAHNIEKLLDKDFILDYDLVVKGLIELLKINAK